LEQRKRAAIAPCGVLNNTGHSRSRTPRKSPRPSALSLVNDQDGPAARAHEDKRWVPGAHKWLVSHWFSMNDTIAWQCRSTQTGDQFVGQRRKRRATGRARATFKPRPLAHAAEVERIFKRGGREKTRRPRSDISPKAIRSWSPLGPFKDFQGEVDRSPPANARQALREAFTN